MEKYKKEVGVEIPDMNISLVDVLKLIDQFIESGTHMTEAMSGGKDPKQAWRWYCKTTGQRELRSAILYEYYYKIKNERLVNEDDSCGE